jgi:geranylgeranylglycerol-phosphate geranylgeranyltransferase
VRRFIDYFKLIRGVNCLLAATAVLVGAYLTDYTIPMDALILTAIAAFLACAGGNAFNDLVDLKVDRIAHPDRVLVSGSIGKAEAFYIAALSSLFGLVLSLFVNFWVFATVLAAILLLVAYNMALKHIPVLGNLTIALLAGLTFIAGGLAVDYDLTWVLPGPLIGSVYAVLFHFVRELMKDVQDLDGDQAAGITTLPRLIGQSPALVLCLVLFFVLVVLTYIPVYYGWFGRYYEILTIYVVDLPMLALLILVWGNPTRRMLRIGSTALKAGMFLGMIALLLGRQQF